jgi:hypothetical protein
MRILLTGATGFLGGHMARRLITVGHELVLLSRNPEAARRNFPAAVHHAWDALRGPPPVEVFAGVEALIHLVGESVAKGRWSVARKRRIRDSRVQSTHHLLDSMRQAPAPRPRIVIGASAVGYYGDRGEEVLREDAAPGQDFLARLCVDWEAALREGATSATRIVSLRTGIVLGRDGGALPMLARLFGAGLGGPLARGQQWMSWIHLEDLISLIEYSLRAATLRGAVNAVAPQPARNADFTRVLARTLRRPAWFAVPRPLLKLVLGEMSSLLLYSQRVVPAAAEATGFAFRFPTLESALADLLGAPGRGAGT